MDGWVIKHDLSTEGTGHLAHEEHPPSESSERNSGRAGEQRAKQATSILADRATMLNRPKF